MTTTDTQAMHLVFDLPPDLHPIRRPGLWAATTRSTPAFRAGAPVRRVIPIRVRTWSLIAAMTLGAGIAHLVAVTS